MILYNYNMRLRNEYRPILRVIRWKFSIKMLACMFCWCVCTVSYQSLVYIFNSVKEIYMSLTFVRQVKIIYLNACTSKSSVWQVTTISNTMNSLKIYWNFLWNLFKIWTYFREKRVGIEQWDSLCWNIMFEYWLLV